MGVTMKLLALALCALSGTSAFNKDLRIGSGGRTIHDFEREVRYQHSLKC